LNEAPTSRLGKYLSSERSALALTLLWFGSGTLLVSLIVGLQAIAAPAAFSLDRRYFVAFAWGIAAIILAILLRRREPGMFLRILGAIWLTSAFAIAAWTINHD
jgi:hypothetical protein